MIERLPEHLAERCRALNAQPAGCGDFVLYWMHHALRDHENPALDAALILGEQLDLPVLVYQGLHGAHRYNNDRHYTFILEAARDVHAALAERDIPAVFQLGDANSKSPLPALIEQAALAIFEDFPAPPFPGWSQRLAENTGTPVWAVDCACIVPMQSVGKAHARAFEFRNATRDEFAKRTPMEWPALDVTPKPFAKLQIDGIAWEHASIPELVAGCAIDHSVGPVPHTRGGMQAANQRWEIFRLQHLADYARDRNNAAIEPPAGVSRMSAYLHYGCISPMLMAREAHAEANSGSKKFLDELLIWRELAYNFCFYHAEVESLAVLPQWARETLEAHRLDARETYTDEQLARGLSNAELWNLAQQSLLIHGELHNNLRMTWGKELVTWSQPERALARLIDLNHRYALDGSDPNSYGGLLWCLGLFDRPFKPAQPVLGTIRPRSSRQHAARLDVKAYAKKIHHPASEKPLRIGVIGAGLSGMLAARILQDHGHQLTLFEKARGPAGRLSSRRARIDEQAFSFDHGAQYFTCRDPRVHPLLDSWLEEGIVAPWDGRIGSSDQPGEITASSAIERYVATPRMSMLGRHLAQDLDVHLQTRISETRFRDGQWQLQDESGAEHGSYDWLIVAVPPEQALPLIEISPALSEAVRQVRFAPAWAVMASFGEPVECAFDGIFANHGPLNWACRNNSKPGRAALEHWVLHTRPEWTQENLETDAADVAQAALGALAELTGAELPATRDHSAHRWLYSIAGNPLDQGALMDAARHLGVCGDWCASSRIEGALLSGMAMAGRLLGNLD